MGYITVADGAQEQLSSDLLAFVRSLGVDAA